MDCDGPGRKSSTTSRRLGRSPRRSCSLTAADFMGRPLSAVPTEEERFSDWPSDRRRRLSSTLSALKVVVAFVRIVPQHVVYESRFPFRLDSCLADHCRQPSRLIVGETLQSFKLRCGV
jgi:hypothetical protein